MRDRRGAGVLCGVRADRLSRGTTFSQSDSEWHPLTHRPASRSSSSLFPQIRLSYGYCSPIRPGGHCRLHNAVVMRCREEQVKLSDLLAAYKSQTAEKQKLEAALERQQDEAGLRAAGLKEAHKRDTAAQSKLADAYRARIDEKEEEIAKLRARVLELSQDAHRRANSLGALADEHSTAVRAGEVLTKQLTALRADLQRRTGQASGGPARLFVTLHVCVCGSIDTLLLCSEGGLFVYLLNSHPMKVRDGGGEYHRFPVLTGNRFSTRMRG